MLRTRALSLLLALLLTPVLLAQAPATAAATMPQARKKVAVITTAYFHNSHADVIASRLLQTDTLDGKGKVSPLEFASLYTDQVPDNDISRRLSKEYHFPIYPTVEEALTLGTGKLAVEGVLLIAEHGKYPVSATGNTQYPKRRLFEQVVKVFEKSGRVVPVFIDKHMADNWEDANWIYTTARKMNIPLMAGSSLPMLWRRPPADVPKDAVLDQIVSVSYHTLDHYGFHALEYTQTLTERRKGGETGIKAVQCLTGPAVWEAGAKGVYDPKLLLAAMGRLEAPQGGDKPLAERVKEPSLFIIEHADGFKAYILTLNGAASEWSAAWRTKDGQSDSTLFWTQEARPFMHFTFLLNGVEKMILTGKPAWPVERTLMTSGTLDALLQSKKAGGQRLETPYLMFSYQSDWTWKNPPPPPTPRPIMEQ